MFRPNYNSPYELFDTQNFYLLTQNFSTYGLYFAATYSAHIMLTFTFLGKKSLTLQ